MISIKELNSTFDVYEYLDDRGLVYSEEGDNVSEGWVNITCPFCGDDKNHMGINLRSKYFHCWICNESSNNMINLIMEVFID